LVEVRKTKKGVLGMKVNQITGETDLSLFTEETVNSQKLTLSELRAEIPGMVQSALRRELAARQRVVADRERAAAIHAHSGDHLAPRKSRNTIF
jgi:hypothetical protein